MAKVRQTYSEPIRQMAVDHFIRPARQAGKREFTISVRQLMDLFSEEFRFNRQGQFCSALVKRTFLDENGLELVGTAGPSSSRSTTVTHSYRFRGGPEEPVPQPMTRAQAEAEAHRLVNGLRGLMKNDFAQFGGGEAFLRWVRSDEPAE